MNLRSFTFSDQQDCTSWEAGNYEEGIGTPHFLQKNATDDKLASRVNLFFNNFIYKDHFIIKQPDEVNPGQ